MKKILLGTTMLVGAAGLFAGAALADTPKVTVGGYENFEVGYISDDLDKTATDLHPNAVDQRHDAFRSDTQVDFKIDGKSDAGLGYGGEVDLLADVSEDVQNRGFNASKTFVYLDGNWGRTEMGSNVGADGTMKVDAGTIARATGGINGDWSYFANAATQFVASPNLPLAYGNLYTHDPDGDGGTYAGSNFTGDHDEENINKVTYYTPRFAGLQLGVSYLPDQTNRGQGSQQDIVQNGNNYFYAPNPPGPDRTADNAGEAANIWTGGLNYDNKFGDVGLTLAATGEYGHAENALYENLSAWNAGGKLSYMGWSLAGSYGSWGKSDRLKADDASDSTYWDVGGAYEYGPFGASLTYMHSQFDCGRNTTNFCTEQADDNDMDTNGTNGHNNFSNISFGVDYKLAPGMTPYAEISRYDENAVGTDMDNKGYVGIVGTQLNF